MPAWQRAAGAIVVMSRPSKMMRPASTNASPAIRFICVVLPAAFGPMMPSASPRLTCSVSRSVTFSEP